MKLCLTVIMLTGVYYINGMATLPDKKSPTEQFNYIVYMRDYVPQICKQLSTSPQSALTIHGLKTKVRDLYDIPRENQAIIYAGIERNDNEYVTQLVTFDSNPIFIVAFRPSIVPSESVEHEEQRQQANRQLLLRRYRNSLQQRQVSTGAVKRSHHQFSDLPSNIILCRARYK